MILKDTCLGFVNDEGEWECGDNCLKQNSRGQLCGTTDHFTNFAILLSSNTKGGNGSCESSEKYNNTIIILSICFVAVALSFIFIGVILIEVSFRYKAAATKKNFKMIGRDMSAANKKL